MLFGLGRSQDVNKALETYKKLDEQINVAEDHLKAIVYNIMGNIYETGKYKTKDMKKAVIYYLKST
jgi:hypothetical protein